MNKIKRTTGKIEWKQWRCPPLTMASRIIRETRITMNKIKKYNACIIKTDGTITETKPKNGTDFSLEELRAAIGGGYIEVVRTVDDSRIMVLDEEGKLKNMPVNPKATALYPNLADVIVGDVVVCKRAMVK